MRLTHVALSLLFLASSCASLDKAFKPRSSSKPAPATLEKTSAAEPATAESTTAAQPAVDEKPAPQKKQGYVSPSERAHPVCKRSIEATATERPMQHWWLENTNESLRERQKLLLEAKRDQFISAARDVTAKDLRRLNMKGDVVVVKKGEPLLLLKCFQDRTMTVMPLDLSRIEIPVDALEPAPTAFTIAQPAPRKFYPSDAFAMATSDEFHGTPGAKEVHDAYFKCQDVGLAACMSAEKKVMAQPWDPGQDARRKDACSDARGAAVDKCLDPKLRKKYVEVAKVLHEKVAAREADFFKQISAKLQ